MPFSQRLPQLIATATLAAALLALFGPLLFADRLPAMRDAGHYYYPLFKWCADQWAAGRPPLWNPSENCGSVICADPTASLWYPGKLVFALPLDFAVRYKLYIVGHAALCAAAAYWLARRWGASVYGSALAALAYSCGGSVLFQHCNVVYLIGAAWLPVAVLLLDRTLREGRWPAAIGLAVVLALMILGGDPQTAYHVLLLGGLYLLVLAAGKREPTAGGVTSPLIRLTLLPIAAAVALLLAAIQILPSAGATAVSERAQFDTPRSVYEVIDQARDGKLDGSLVRAGLLGQPKYGTHHDTVYHFSVAPWRFAELVWPNCGGRMYPTHRRWFSLLPEEQRIWSPSLYLGLLPLVFGLGALCLRSGDGRIRWLSWIVLLFTLGSLGTFGLGWMARHVWQALGESGVDFPLGDPVGGVYWLLVVLLPKYVYFRFPAKLLVVASLGLSILAASGWDRALAGASRRLPLFLLVLGLGSAAAALAACVAAQFIMLGDGQSSIAFGPFDNPGAWTDILRSLLQTAIVSLTAAWLLNKSAAEALSPKQVRGALQPWATALLALSAAELALANYWLVPTAPANLWREPSAIAQAIHRDSPGARAYRAQGFWPPEFGRTASPRRLEEMAAWERQSLAGRYGLLDGVAIVDAQASLKRADHEELLDRAGRAGRRDQQQNALQRLGAQYLIVPAAAKPASAEPIQGDEFPAGAALWRLTAPPLPESEQVHYHFDPGPFYRGAAISAAAWALVAGLFAWRALRRRIVLKSNNSAPA